MIHELIVTMIGLTTGIVSGITGLGGSFVLFILLYYLNVIKNYNTIKGTILYTFLFPITLGSVYNFYNSGNIEFYTGNFLVLGIIMGGYLGSKLLLSINPKDADNIAKKVGGIILIICGILYMR
jgi:uncharacterized membrane protein YfcA